MLPRLLLLLVAALAFSGAGASPTTIGDPAGDTDAYVWPAVLPVVGWQPAPSGACADAGVDVLGLALSSNATDVRFSVTLAGPRGLTCAGMPTAPSYSSYQMRVALWGGEPSVSAYRDEWRGYPEACVQLHWYDFDDASWCAPAEGDDAQWTGSIPLVGRVVTESGLERDYDLRGARTTFADTWASHEHGPLHARSYVGIRDETPFVPVTL